MLQVFALLVYLIMPFSAWESRLGCIATVAEYLLPGLSTVYGHYDKLLVYGSRWIK